ncbi:MAG: hypothetical protein V1847_01085, partial [Candidatus Diapherotrites archaeon]
MEQKRAFEYALQFFIIYFVLTLFFSYIDFSALENFLAQTVGNALGLLTAGNQIQVGTGAFAITSSCT